MYVFILEFELHCEWMFLRFHFETSFFIYDSVKLAE